MKLSGWIFLILSWGFIIGLCVFCLKQIFRIRTESLVYPLEVEMELEEKDDERMKKEEGN